MFVVKKILLMFFKFMITVIVFFSTDLKTGMEKTEMINETRVKCICHVQSGGGALAMQ